MTVTNGISALDARLDQLRAAQLEWLEAEFAARAAYALIRLDRLDSVGLRLTRADRFDAAYAIWDDYIDGRRADERGEALPTPQLREQASIFARVARYLPPGEALALAARAWGTETFEVFTRNPDGTCTGKLGWYRGDQLNVTTILDGRGELAARPFVEVLDVWTEQGRAHSDRWIKRLRHGLALHPIFGRAVA